MYFAWLLPIPARVITLLENCAENNNRGTVLKILSKRSVNFTAYWQFVEF